MIYLLEVNTRSHIRQWNIARRATVKYVSKEYIRYPYNV